MKTAVCSDLHLNNSNYGKSNKDGLTFRTRDFMRAFEFVTDECSGSLAAGRVVICGDIYDNPHPPNHVREFFASQIKKLSVAGIEVHILVGNHDACFFHHALQPLNGAGIDNVTIHYDRNIVETPDELMLFLPHSEDVERNELTFRESFIEFSKDSAVRVNEAKALGKKIIFFGHFPVYGAKMSDGAYSYDGGQIRPADLATLNADYVFLGDFHGFQVLDVPDCVAMYSGSLERSSMGDVNSDKGFVIYDPEAEIDPQLNQVRRVIYPHVRPMLDITGTTEEILDVVENHSGNVDEAIIRIKFEGTTELYRQFCDKKKEIKKTLEGCKHLYFERKLIDPERESKVKELKQEIEDTGHLESSDILKIIKTCVEQDVEEQDERDATMVIAGQIVKVVQAATKMGDGTEGGRVSIHGVKMNNFQRYGEKDNVVEFDQGSKKVLATIPRKGVIKKEDVPAVSEAAKAFLSGLDPEKTTTVSIIGKIEGNEADSNGAGKTGVLEAISYSFFEKIVREFSHKEQIRGSSTTSVIRTIDGVMEKDCYVDVLFSSEQELWLLRRGRKTTKSGSHSGQLALYCLSNPKPEEDGSFSGHRKEDAESKIEQLIQMDYETFSNSLMFGQNDAGRFIRGTDKVKKEILIKILRLTILNAYLEETRKRKGQAEKVVAALESQVEALSERIMTDEQVAEAKKGISKSDASIKKEEAAAAAVRVEIETLRKDPSFAEKEGTSAKLDLERSSVVAKEKEIEERHKALVERNQESEEKKNRIAKSVTSGASAVATTEARIVAIEAAIASFDKDQVDKDMDLIVHAKKAKPGREAELAEILERKAKAVSDGAGIQASLRIIEPELAKFETKLKQFGQGTDISCPECESLVTQEHIQKKVNEKSVALRDLKVAKDEADKREAAESAKESEVKERLRNIEEYVGKEVALVLARQENESKIKELAQAQASLKEQKDSLAAMTVELTAAEKELTEAADELSKAKATGEAELAPLKASVEELVRIFGEKTEAVALVERQIAEKESQAKIFIQHAQDFASAKASAETRISESETTKAMIAEKEKGAGNEKAELLRLARLESYFGQDGIRAQIIEKYIPLLNSHIEDFLDITSKGRMASTVLIDESDKVQMTVTGSSAPSPELVSGGEFVALRLAVDLSLGMLSLMRNDNAPDFVCLDEVFAQVDFEGKKRMFDVINMLQNDFRTVIVISHDSFIKEKIKNTIVVNKINDVSTIEKQVFETVAA
jgi:exonuclease SbcC